MYFIKFNLYTKFGSLKISRLKNYFTSFVVKKEIAVIAFQFKFVRLSNPKVTVVRPSMLVTVKL